MAGVGRRHRPGSVTAACVLVVRLQVPDSHSLKAKRAVVKHLVASAHQRYGVAAAETGEQDTWQLAELGFAAVGSSASHVGEVLDSVERYVWSHPECTVLSCERRWLE